MISLIPVLLFYYQQFALNNYSPELVKDYIATEALVMGLDPTTTQIAVKVAEAESGFNPQAIGDHGTSIGLYQIHLPAHRDISKAQAQDVIFSTNWALQEMKANSCKIWSTCSQAIQSIKKEKNSLPDANLSLTKGQDSP